MTPKEKAIDLVESFMLWKFQKCELSKKQARQCALIAVDEIIGQWEIIDVYLANGNGQLNQNLEYWYTVKKEINKL